MRRRVEEGCPHLNRLKGTLLSEEDLGWVGGKHTDTHTHTHIHTHDHIHTHTRAHTHTHSHTHIHTHTITYTHTYTPHHPLRQRHLLAVAEREGGGGEINVIQNQLINSNKIAQPKPPADKHQTPYTRPKPQTPTHKPQTPTYKPQTPTHKPAAQRLIFFARGNSRGCAATCAHVRVHLRHHHCHQQQQQQQQQMNPEWGMIERENRRRCRPRRCNCV